MAIWLGAHLSKDEILTRYLNRVYLGDGAYRHGGGGAALFRQEVRPI